MLSIPASSSSKSSSLKEELRKDLFRSMVLPGGRSPIYYRHLMEGWVGQTPSLIRRMGDPVVDMIIQNFKAKSQAFDKLRKIIVSQHFSIHNNPANVCRRKNIVHQENILIFITEIFHKAWRNIRFACCIAEFLMERPVDPNEEIIYLPKNRLTTHTTHKKIRIRQIVNTLYELGHIDDPLLKGHLIAWYDSDPDNIDNMTSLYVQSNQDRDYLEANNIPVRDMEVGCPLFVFLKPYFDHKEGVNSPGLKIVKEMSARFFDSYHI